MDLAKTTWFCQLGQKQRLDETLGLCDKHEISRGFGSKWSLAGFKLLSAVSGTGNIRMKCTVCSKTNKAKAYPILPLSEHSSLGGRSL